ncbi:MAG: hypothetical protein QOG34_2383 [Frankiaceae bacterium]|jgi:hypothetical protein|nr:hypothetical protein [Frankiaceae bacterium]
MRRVFIAGVVLASAVVVAVPSSAATTHNIRGGCGYDSVEVTPAGGYTGLMYEVSATTVGGVGTAPIGATVTCWITVNGTEAPGTRHTYGDLNGPGVQAGADRISFTAQPHDFVNECQSVVYADNTTSDPDFDCPAIAPIGFPPQPILDLANTIVRVAQSAVCNDERGEVCALLCPQLQRLAGDYGPLTIAPDGDVVVVDQYDVGYNPVFDCPPYLIQG